MARKSWKKSKAYPGIEYRSDPTKPKVGVQFDCYFRARMKVLGKTYIFGFGWWSAGWNAKKCYEKAQTYRENLKTGQRPTSWSEEQELLRKQAESQERKDITFKNYFEKIYFPDSQKIKNPSSYLKEEQHVRTWLSPSVGDKPLRKINADDLTDLRNKMLEQGKALRTVQHVFSTFRLIWNHAHKKEIVQQASPTRLVKLGTIQNERTSFLTSEQIKELLEYLKIRDQLSHDLVLTALCTGARAGELFRLTWDMVDLQNDEIRLIHTKTGEPRTIPMIPELKETLKQIRARATGELVFTRNGKPLKQAPSPIYDALNKLFNQGVKDRRERFTFHSMRHTAASHMLKAGVDVRTIQALFGWSTLQMLQRYSHVVDKQKRSALQNLKQEYDKVGDKSGKVIPIQNQTKINNK